MGRREGWSRCWRAGPSLDHIWLLGLNAITVSSSTEPVLRDESPVVTTYANVAGSLASGAHEGSMLFMQGRFTCSSTPPLVIICRFDKH